MNPVEDVITIDIDEKMTHCDFLSYAADCRWILQVIGMLDAIKPLSNGLEVWDTRRGHHVKIPLAIPLKPVTVIELQLFLNSDKKREAFNYRRMLNGKFRSYLFDAKFTKDSSFVNERNQRFVDVWKYVFEMEEKKFDEAYGILQKNKHGEKQNAGKNIPLDDGDEGTPRRGPVRLQDLFAPDS